MPCTTSSVFVMLTLFNSNHVNILRQKDLTDKCFFPGFGTTKQHRGSGQKKIKPEYHRDMRVETFDLSNK